MPSNDLLSETMACDLLARLFRERGYTVSRNIPFREYGVLFHIDGWDAKARVGFEFLTSEDEDHDDLTLEEYKTLMASQQRGELALFIIDEVEPLSVADLKASAEEFLDEVAEAVAAQRARRRPAKKASRKKAVKKTAKKKAGKKKAGKVTRKPAKKAAPKTRATKKKARRRT